MKKTIVIDADINIERNIDIDSPRWSSWSYLYAEGKTLDEVVNREKQQIVSPDDADGCAVCHL